MIVIRLPDVSDPAGAHALDTYASRRGRAGYICSVEDARAGQGAEPAVAGAVSSSACRLIEQYGEKGFAETDPVQGWVREHTVPVIWTVDEFRSSGDQRQRDLFSLVADHGFRSGVSIPFFGPFNIRGTLVALDRADSINMDRAIEEVKESAPIGNSLVTCACRQTQPASPSPSLTARERECMRWVAMGKTSWEIALILSISSRTVDFHVRNAMAKLDATSRQQAIYNAMSLGILNAPVSGARPGGPVLF